MPELFDGELVWKNGLKSYLWLLREFIWARDEIVKFLAPVKDLFQRFGDDLLCLVELVLYWMESFDKNLFKTPLLTFKNRIRRFRVLPLRYQIRQVVVHRV